MLILAIDQGTSGTKALLLHDGEIIARANAHVQVNHFPDGRVECNPQEVWNSIKIAVVQALEGNKLPIDALSLANQGESVLAWNKKSLEPLSPVIIWQDSRAQSLCRARDNFNDVIRSRTGLENDPYFVAPKIRWLRDNFQSDCVITTLDSWLIAKLTNKFATDPSTASRSMLVDLKSGNWDLDLLRMWDLENELLPEIVKNDAIVGEIVAADLPQLKGVPLAGLIVDQSAALLAQNCLELGEAKCTYGTGAFLLSNIGETPNVSRNKLSVSLAWDISSHKRYYEDGQVFTAASAVDWLIEIGLLRSANDIDSLPLHSNGVVALPGFAGFGAPRWKPDGSATITGLTLGSSKDDIARAVINGIAAQVNELINVIESDGVKVKKLRVDGGLTQSKTLMQMQADLSQVEIEVFPHPDATAVGVGILGTLAMNPGKDLKDAIPHVTPSARYRPQWSQVQAEDFMQHWHNSTQSLTD